MKRQAGLITLSSLLLGAAIGLASLPALAQTKTLRMVAHADVKILDPPGVPITIATRPSRSRMVGLIDDSGRLPGAMAFASPPTTP